ncbi:MAG: PEP-CTERM sorting domain-containing protein [Spartobacteria bacterium]|nr:PEP-CTERM sorting domain-containing protein [Spartobacteria bacterium]
MSSLYKLIFVTAVTAMCLTTNARADLIININTATEEFSFSGSDSGTPEHVAGAVSNMRWEFGTNLGGISSGVTVTPGIDYSGLDVVSHAASVASSDGSYLTLNLTFTANAPWPFTLGSIDFSGNGSTFSYAGWDTDNKNLISSLNNSDILTPTRGTDVSPVSVNVIPEPTTFGLLLAAASSLFIARRRQAV